MYGILGIIVIIVSLAITTWWLLGQHPHKGWAFLICIVALLVGAFLMLEESATKLTVKGIGTIKSASEQAKVNAKAVTDLKDRTEAQAQTVDRIAKKAAEAEQLLNILSLNNQMAENNLSRLNRAIADENIAVRELQLLTNVNKTILSASNDNRQAYEQLQVWSKDSSFRFQKEASQAATMIMERHNLDAIKSDFNISWDEDVDPQSLSIDELWDAYNNSDPYIRIGVLEFLWKERADIPLRDRLQFLIDVLKGDDSLLVAEYAGRFFSDGTTDGFRPIDIDSHLKWWEDNKDSIQ